MQILLSKTGIMQTGNNLDKLPQEIIPLVRGCQTVPHLKGRLCVGQEIEDQSRLCIVQLASE